MMEKLLSIAFGVLWGIAVVYALVLVVSGIVKGVRKLKARKKGVVIDRDRETGRDQVTS